MNAKGVLFVVAVVALLVVAALMFRTTLEPSTATRPATRDASARGPAAPIERNTDLGVGIAALGEGRMDEALARLGAVPVTDPEYPQALLHLGLAHEQLGDTAAAFAALERLVEVQPEDPRSYHSLSWLQYRQGRYADAENSILRALELAPSSAELRYDLALFRLLGGDLQRAIDSYTRAMELEDQGDYVLQAYDHLEQVHEQRPDLVDVHYAIAFFANALGQVAGEREELKHYIAANPAGPGLEAAKARLSQIEQQAGSH